MKLRILIVDDHFLMVEGYKSILAFNNSEHEISITTAYSCEEAFKCITHNSIPFDLVLLDLGLPPYKKEGLTSGKDLALLAKQYLPFAKIVFLTSHVEAFVLYDIIKEVNPSGLLVKSDFTANEFLTAFDSIVNNEVYYTTTVKQYLNDVKSSEVYLDNYNRQIISLLSQGIKTKSLPDYLPLSISAIDKRKALIKDYFNIDKGNDEDILRAAKKAGLI